GPSGGGFGTEFHREQDIGAGHPDSLGEPAVTPRYPNPRPPLAAVNARRYPDPAPPRAREAPFVCTTIAAIFGPTDDERMAGVEPQALAPRGVPPEEPLRPPPGPRQEKPEGLGRRAQEEEGKRCLHVVGRQIHAGSPAGNRPREDDLLRLRIEGIELLHLLPGLPLEREHPRPAHGHEG